MRVEILSLIGIGLASLSFACSSDESSSRPGIGGTSGSGGSAGSGGSSASAGNGGTAGASGSGGSGGSGGSAAGAGGSPSGAWSMGYWASWDANDYPASAIEWSGMTHIAVSFYMPDQNGGLSLLGGNPDVAKTIVDGAHQHGVKAIASIGGADSGPAFVQATASGTLDTFVQNLVSLIEVDGYDGIDIDWEPLEVSNEPAAIAIATKVRAAHPSAIITIPIGYQNVNMPGDLSGYPALAAAYDQLNIMSYGMAGIWSGWKSWHSSPLHHQDSATPLSISSSVDLYVQAGVPKNKLGIGIGFFGLCYTPPVTGPDQDLGSSTIAASDGSASYANIMTDYFADAARQWDPLARVPYLSFSSAQGPAGCSYISYDDEQSIAEKATYLKSEGLGGVIMWEINEGYLPSAAQKNPLLSAIHDQILN